MAWRGFRLVEGERLPDLARSGCCSRPTSLQPGEDALARASDADLIAEFACARAERAVEEEDGLDLVCR
jgi:hypothetical protein